MTYRKAALVFVVALPLPLPCALGLACSKTPEPEGTVAPARDAPTAATTSTAAAKPAAPTPPASTEITWDPPAAWQKAENPSPMRKATYKIPRAGGDTEDAEMSVSQAGGTVDMNVKRWSGQFETKEPDATKRTERKVGELKVTIVEISGTFTGSGMPGGPAGAAKPGYALLGAIVETPGAPWFFKMTGPEKTVTAAKGDFESMVQSIRQK